MSENPEQNIRYDISKLDSWKDYLPWILMLITVVWMSIQLWFQGRIWWCKWDTPIYIWSSDVWSKHNSQHFLDPYFFTHVLHGVLFYWIAFFIFRTILKQKFSPAWLLLVVIFAESVWELVENSQTIIERYRENTASLDYYGDSIANSIGDIFACVVGFLIAYKFRLWWSLAIFLLIEIILIFTIRDSLLINILMLIYPIEAIKIWQTGA